MVERRGERVLRLNTLAPALMAALFAVGCASTPTAPESQEPAAPLAQVAPENTLGVAVSVPPQLIRPAAPTRYVVVKGDTLWDISSRFLSNPWLWPEIWLVNPQIKNPHLIYPGDIVSLEWINGKPVLRIERDDGIKRLKPIVRTTPLPQPVPALPMDAIQSFIQHARFIDEGAAENAPYMLAAADGHLMAAKGMDIYARGFGEDRTTTWQMVRAGKRYYDPVTAEYLGQEGIGVGTAEVLVVGDPARLRIENSLREALPGDLLFPVPEEEFIPELLLQPVAEDIEARVVAGFDVITRVGQFQIITLNCGSEHDLALGATFEGFAQNTRIEDNVRGDGALVTLPGEYRGLAVVFRIDEKVAHALVMNAEQPMQAGDHLRSPLLSAR